jgi:hypothetical protein
MWRTKGILLQSRIVLQAALLPDAGALLSQHKPGQENEQANGENVGGAFGHLRSSLVQGH